MDKPLWHASCPFQTFAHMQPPPPPSCPSSLYLPQTHTQRLPVVLCCSNTIFCSLLPSLHTRLFTFDPIYFFYVSSSLGHPISLLILAQPSSPLPLFPASRCLVLYSAHSHPASHHSSFILYFCFPFLPPAFYLSSV